MPFKVTDFRTNRKLICDFLLVINTNLPPILHRFWAIAFDRSKIAIFGYPSCLTPPMEAFPWDDLRKNFRGCQRIANVPNAVEILQKITIFRVGCTSITDRQTDRQTDGQVTANSSSSRSLKITVSSNNKRLNTTEHHVKDLHICLPAQMHTYHSYFKRFNGNLGHPYS